MTLGDAVCVASWRSSVCAGVRVRSEAWWTRSTPRRTKNTLRAVFRADKRAREQMRGGGRGRTAERNGEDGGRGATSLCMAQQPAENKGGVDLSTDGHQ